MKTKLLIFLFFYAPYSFAAGVITFGDAMSIGPEANASLHKAAQQRTQIEIEDFTGKKLTRPYIAADGFEPVYGGKRIGADRKNKSHEVGLSGETVKFSVSIPIEIKKWIMTLDGKNRNDKLVNFLLKHLKKG